jgi:RimJ/RimL family protein N-acetyltransferase
VTPSSVSLREVLEADLPPFFEHQIDPEASRMADFPSRDESTFREHWGRILADEGVIKRTIVADGVVAGYVGAYRESGRLQVGYWLGRAHWGRGLATAALSLFFEDLSERPIWAFVALRNIASRRVLEKCGFVLATAAPGEAQEGEELLFARTA